MSFSSDVKNELCKINEPSRAGRKLLLFGLLYGARAKGNAVALSSLNEQPAELLKKLASEFDADLSNMKKLKDDIALGGGDNETGIFLRGVFLSCGTVSDPGKDYHLELNPPSEKRRNALHTLITESGIPIKKSVRKKENRSQRTLVPLLYIKESELVSDFLTFIGAGVNSMEVMNAKIFKEMRNNVNRAVNCEAANIGKTARAAGKQIADIELIYEKKGVGFLPPELKQVAEIRLNNFEMSLKEIGEECEPRLSRSGVFHRLERIAVIAERLRNENQD